MSLPRDREHDEWIPWYVEDTPGWLELSLAARGAMEGIARKLNRKTGTLVLRRGLPSLALLLGRPWAEIEPALGELIASGKLEWNGSLFQLVDPEYGERRRRTSADRMAAKRTRDRQSSYPPPPSGASDGCDVTSVTVTPVTVGDGCSSLIFSDLISDLGSDAGAREEVTGLRAVVPRPTPAGPPAWFVQAIGVIAMATGIQLPEAEAWLRYEGHRAGKGIAPSTQDAQYWLTGVMVPEAREVLRRVARDRERDAKFKPGGRVEPPEKLQPTKAQAEAMAEELAARVRAMRAAGGIR